MQTVVKKETDKDRDRNVKNFADDLVLKEKRQWKLK